MTITSQAILACLLAATFAALAAIGGPANGWDGAIAGWAAQFRADSVWAAHMAAAITVLGSAQVTLGVSSVAALWLLLRRMPRTALLLAATVLLERLLVDTLKVWFARPRPHLEDLPASFAFPSGHAANSMAAFLAIALIAVPGRYRRTAVFAALAATIAIGTTRIVLGVHWTSDVLGGWTLGLLTVGLATSISVRSAAIRLEAQHDVVARHGPPAGKDKSA